MKILFSASKEMNLENLQKKENDINFNEVNDIIEYIKSVSPKDSLVTFKTKDNNIYELHQNINILSKPAIQLFNGISFRQIKDKNNPKLKDVLIFSALYGASYAFDKISFFRYDYTMNYANKNKKEIYKKINKILENEDIIFNLASKEFTNLIKHHNKIDFSFYLIKDNKLVMQSTISKKMRGLMLDYLVNEDDLSDLNIITKFKEEGFIYNRNESSSNHYVFIKQ